MIVITGDNFEIKSDETEVDQALAENLDTLVKALAPDLEKAGCLILRDEDAVVSKINVTVDGGNDESMTAIVMSPELTAMLFGKDPAATNEVKSA